MGDRVEFSGAGPGAGGPSGAWHVVTSALLVACAALAASASGPAPEGGLAGPASGGRGELVFAPDAAAVVVAHVDADRVPDVVSASSAGGVLVQSGADGVETVYPGARLCALARWPGASGVDSIVGGLVAGGLVLWDGETGETSTLGEETVSALTSGDVFLEPGIELVAVVEGAGGLLVGDSLLETYTPIPLSGVATAVAAADFLGLGYDQLAIALGSGAVEVLDLRTDEEFVVAAPVLVDVAPVDLDGNGVLELAGRTPSGAIVVIELTPEGVASWLDLAGADTSAEGGSISVVFDTPVPPAGFVRADANDDGVVDVSDAVAVLEDLFLGVPVPAACADALDANDSGSIDVSDPVYALIALFGGGTPIPPPFPGAGIDPTPDDLPVCLAE